MDLVEAVYDVPRKFPKDELFGLTSQIRRAAVSVPSNVAEGQGRGSANEFYRYLSISYGSLREIETQLLIALRLQYVTESDIAAAQDLCEETGRLLNGLMKRLKAE
jgi:four helix bundle protein